jgi:hypothetical protein
MQSFDSLFLLLLFDDLRRIPITEILRVQQRGSHNSIMKFKRNYEMAIHLLKKYGHPLDKLQKEL